MVRGLEGRGLSLGFLLVGWWIFCLFLLSKSAIYEQQTSIEFQNDFMIARIFKRIWH